MDLKHIAAYRLKAASMREIAKRYEVGLSTLSQHNAMTGDIGPVAYLRAIWAWRRRWRRLWAELIRWLDTYEE